MDEQMMIKYLQGTCSPEEEAVFLEWLNQSDDHKKTFYEKKALWNYRYINQFSTEDQINKALERFNRHIRSMELRKIRNMYISFVKIAAIIILAIAVPVILYISYHEHLSNHLITLSVAQTDSSKLIVLSDGSRIWLNSHSSITYPQKFTKGKEWFSAQEKLISKLNTMCIIPSSYKPATSR